MIPTRESPRIRRLRSDLRAMEQLRRDSSILVFDTRSVAADPPHEYHLRFYGRSVWQPSPAQEILWRDVHEVTIRLGASYPRTIPELLWRTPVFHPNISGSGVVCLGGYGSFWAPSLNLDELCNMLWDMVRYANFDVNSPYNKEAALWARTQSETRFPLDPRPLRDRIAQHPRTTSTSVRPQPAPVPDILFLGDVIDKTIVDAEIVEDD